jgi:hypothetical protein
MAQDAAGTDDDDAADAAFYPITVETTKHDNSVYYNIHIQNMTDAVVAEIEQSGENKRILKSQLASDHGIMILDAIERLGSL